MDELLEKIDFFIYHFNEIDVADLIVLQQDLLQYQKETIKNKEQIHQLKRELFKIKKKACLYLLEYDPDRIIKKLNIDEKEFYKRNGSYSEAEMDEILL